MSDLDPIAIGQRIKEVRGALTQAEFSIRLGVGRVSVVRYEGGQRTPDAEFIAKMCSVFGVDPMWLLVGNPKRDAPSPPALSRREAALLENYLAADDVGKKVIEGTALLATQQARAHRSGSR